MRTLVRHEQLFTPWLTLAGTLGMGGRLDPRERELLILRVALRTESAYAWGGHAQLALGVGLTRAEIAAVSDASATWSDSDAALLHAADELCTDNCVSEATWAALVATHDNVQLIELLALAGFYRMNAGISNSLGVELEPGRGLGEAPTDNVSVDRPSTTTPPRATTSPGGVGLAGTWRTIFHHPTGDQDLTLDLNTSHGEIGGAVINPALKVTVPLVEGKLDGDRFWFRAPMSVPVQLEIRYEGTLQGDSIAGSITIQGGGTFPFDGIRT